MATAKRFDAPINGVLTDAMVRSWHDDGYLILENYVTADQCKAIMNRSAEIVEEIGPDALGEVFDAVDNSHSGDDYFLTSGDKIRVFFESGIHDADGNLTVPIGRAANKIGHAMHDLDPVFEAFSRTAKLANTATSIGLTAPGLLQSMVIFKHAHVGGEVGLHQDSTFIITEPESCVGFWFALQDATTSNGAMKALPGGHKGPLSQVYRRDDNGGISMITLDAPAWDLDALVDLEAPQGTLILLHGRLPHQSAPNNSDKSRQAYTLHVIDTALVYPKTNWLQRPATMPLRGFRTT